MSERAGILHSLRADCNRARQLVNGKNEAILLRMLNY